MKILMLPFKILALPVMLALFLLSLLGKLITNISAYIAGLLMLVVLLIAVYCLWAHRWVDFAIVAGIEVAMLVLQFGAMFIAEVAGEWSGSLRKFICS